MHRDDAFALVAYFGPDLLEQVLAQRTRPRGRLFYSWAIICVEQSVVIAPWLGLATQLDPCHCSAASDPGSPERPSGRETGAGLSSVAAPPADAASSRRCSCRSNNGF